MFSICSTLPSASVRFALQKMLLKRGVCFWSKNLPTISKSSNVRVKILIYCCCLYRWDIPSIFFAIVVCSKFQLVQNCSMLSLVGFEPQTFDVLGRDLSTKCATTISAQTYKKVRSFFIVFVCCLCFLGFVCCFCFLDVSVFCCF